MRKLVILPFVTSTVGFPPKEGTWDFLQQAFTELFNQLLLQQYNNTNPGGAYPYRYALYGMYNAVTHMKAGAIFDANLGEIFVFDFQTIPTPGGSDVLIINIATTQYGVNADPVTFTDGSINNVHNIRKAVLSTGPTGSGDLGDFSALLRINTNKWTIGIDANATIVYSGTYIPDSFYPLTMVKKNNRVYIKGKTDNSSPASSLSTSIIGTTADINFIPLTNQIFNVVDGVSGNNIRLTIDTSGNIEIGGTGISNYDTYIDISYDLDA